MHPIAQDHLLLPRKPVRSSETFSINGGVTRSLLSIRSLHTHRGCVESTERTWTQGSVIKKTLCCLKKTLRTALLSLFPK